MVQHLGTWDTIARYFFPENLLPSGVRFHNMYIFTTFWDGGLNIFTFPTPVNSNESRAKRLKSRCLRNYNVSGRLIVGEYRGVVFCWDGKRFRKLIKR